ncbi:MAG: glycosyltransferase family 4 protein [Lachnospiraceae bacterium]|nr:glycosyltransferase family 4 protein [Lachnospiraceae bacterium]
MKVLITSDWYKPVINGVVTSVINLANGLEEKGHEVKILTLSNNVRSHVDGNVTYIGSVSAGKIYPNARIRVSLSRKLINELIEWKPDIIHSQCEFSTFIIAKHIARKCDAPIVHTYHTVYEDFTHYFSPSKRVGKYMVSLFSRKLLTRTDAVVAPTDKVKELLEGYGVKEPIYTVPSGLELKDIYSSIEESDRDALRNELGIDKDERVLVYLGRIAKEKNIEEILEMLHTVDGPRLLIVGDGPYRHHIEEKVKKLKLENRVIFTGMVSPEEVAKYYKVGDVFVSASQSETQGLTYIEAMACGLPILCKEDACLDDVVDNGINGFTYSTKEEFEKELHKLLSDESYREKMGERAADTIRKNYSTEAFATNAEYIYTDVLEQEEK